MSIQIFRKVVKKKTSLEEARRILSKVKESLAEEVVKERDKEWR